MRIAAISYTDQDVYDGMCVLLDSYPNALVLFPITEHKQFVDSVAKALKERSTPYALYLKETTNELMELVEKAVDIHITDTPLDDVMEEVSHGDLLALVEDGSDDLEHAINSLDEKGLGAWAFDSDKAPLDDFEDEYDEEDGEGDLIDALDVFTEALVKYITKKSLEAMRSAIMKAVIDQVEDFEDEDDEEF